MAHKDNRTGAYGPGVSRQGLSLARLLDRKARPHGLFQLIVIVPEEAGAPWIYELQRLTIVQNGKTQGEEEE